MTIIFTKVENYSNVINWSALSNLTSEIELDRMEMAVVC